ncbi:hypothetical protein [Paenibacillus taichungensis]|uniref:hypothetical protein n=1 Tax=Paenibacillus taichungensis TaxID=484184 RepID=UPI003D9A4714
MIGIVYRCWPPWGDKACPVSIRENLKGLVKDVDVRSGERVTAYEIDVLEYFERGDTVGIGDPELDIDEQQRIVGYSYSPRRRINIKVTISNAFIG